MDNSMIRVLIETVVKKTLTEIQNNPQRSIRNLVDMALHFTKGGFQQNFFQAAQTTLQNENSAYYRLVPDGVNNINHQRIMDFGINLGYNSCIEGAKTIRDIEKAEQFNIPWAMTLTIDGNDYILNQEKYHDVIRQGMELGIFTWMIFCTKRTDFVLDIAHHFPDCAFMLMCKPADIDHFMLDEAESINNIMFCIQYDNQTYEACQLLRNRKHLYCTCYTYSENDIPAILSDEIIQNAEEMHAVFTVFIPDSSCSDSSAKMVYKHIVETRNRQKYTSVPWDYYYDSMYIDSIISDDCCSVFADRDGRLYSYAFSPVKTGMNIFTMPLKEIFRLVFSKQA